MLHTLNRKKVKRKKVAHLGPLAAPDSSSDVGRRRALTCTAGSADWNSVEYICPKNNVQDSGICRLE